MMCTTNDCRQGGGGGGILLVLALLVIPLVLMGALASGMALPSISAPTIPDTLADEAYWTQASQANGAVLQLALEDIVNRNGNHAVIKHGAVAEEIARACSQNGPQQVWKSKSWRSPNKYTLGCVLPDGTWGAWIVECTARGWMWVTSFIVKDGSKAKFVEYASAKNTPFRDVIPQCGGG